MQILDLVRETITEHFLSFVLINSSNTACTQLFCKLDDPRLATFLEVADQIQSKWKVHTMRKDFNKEAILKFAPEPLSCSFLCTTEMQNKIIKERNEALVSFGSASCNQHAEQNVQQNTSEWANDYSADVKDKKPNLHYYPVSRMHCDFFDNVAETEFNKRCHLYY